MHFRIHQFDLGLALKLWVRVLDTDDGSQSFTRVIPCEVGIIILEQTAAAGVVINCACHRGSQTGQVGTAINGINRIRKGINRLRVGVRVLYCCVNRDIVHFLLDIHHRVQRFPVAVQISYK